MGTLGAYSKSLPSSGVSPTSLGRVLGKSQKLPDAEFWVSPRNLLCGVSFPGGATGGVGVDERIEGASGRPPGFLLLDVYQVEQAAQIRPLVEPHSGMAILDDSNQASDEVEAVRTVITHAVTSVDLHGDRLVHAAPRRDGRARSEGGCPGRVPRPNPAVTETLAPRVSDAVK